MAVNILGTHPKRYVEIVAPVAQTSTNAYVALAGTEIDTGIWMTLSYTIKVATFSVDWKVMAGNQADYSDEVAVKAEAAVAAGAVDSYAVTIAPYRYYRVVIKSTVPGSHGAATVVGVAKS